MNRIDDKRRKRLKRKRSIRKRITGSTERPRMSVFRSNRHMYVQVIDDSRGHTIASASNLEKENRGLKTCTDDALKLGEIIGNRLKEQKVTEVVFDRNGYPYHGIVKGIAEGTRKAGIKF